MIWLNVHLPTLRTDAFLHATSAQLGQWLSLCAYCAEQENGGRIKNCRNWAPATWVKITGTETPGDLCPLWAWRKDDLIMLDYPKRQEFKAQHDRARAKHAAETRWNRPRKKRPIIEGD